LLLIIPSGLPKVIFSRLRDFSSLVYKRRYFTVLIPVLAAILFFAFRNEFLNYDGRTLASKFTRDIPSHGAHVTHDEMWELCIHSWFWYYTNLLFGWSVNVSYKVISSLAGGAFVYLLASYTRILFRKDFLPVLLLVLCGGYAQLFFGDVENYTLTAVLIMGYMLSSLLYIRGRTSILLPSALFAIAVTFHLLSFFLLPSLIYLAFLSFRRGEKVAVLVSALASCAIMVLTLLFFDWYCLPLKQLWYQSHALGHGGHIRMMLTRPSWGYFLGLFNLSMLLAPAWLLLIPLLLKRRIQLDGTNMHLLLASCSMAVFFLGWRATLGVYEDWNLYANAAIPLQLLIFRNLFQVARAGKAEYVVLMPAWLFFLNSYSWIISNHFYQAG
jgi:hypothetical protein